jgi:putative transposase
VRSIYGALEIEMEIRRTYKYRLYTSKRDKHLQQQIDVAGIIWNHSLAVQKRYYRLTGKYVGKIRLITHIGKMRRTERFGYWQLVGSQAVQEVVERLDKAYRRFFAYLRGDLGIKTGSPRFKKVKKYKSFTLKQSGWKLLGGNRIRLNGRNYKFVLSRPVVGEIKTVTVKRDHAGRLFVCLSVIEEVSLPVEASTGKIGGFDFGLKTFLTDDDGGAYQSPEFLKASLSEIARLNRRLSRKQEGSNNRKQAKRQLALAHDRVANERRDAHFKLAHALCGEYDALGFETLNLRGMKKLWGRKISDLGFSQFMLTLEHVARMRGKQVVKIGQWEPTSQTCSCCCNRQSIELRERWFTCGSCGLEIGRDHNAARNIRREAIALLGVGASTPSLDGVRQSFTTASLA